MEENLSEKYIRENCKVFDRFTFDYLFKKLLKDGYGHEEAKDIIINNCAFSALVLQERIHSKYYLQINEDDYIANDLLKLKNEIYDKYFLENKNE